MGTRLFPRSLLNLANFSLGVPFNPATRSVRGLVIQHGGNASPITIEKVRKLLETVVGSSQSFNEDRDESIRSLPLPTSQGVLSPRCMADSYQKAYIPLSSDVKLREKYINFHNTVRFGRIMEDLDTMAVWICYNHNSDPTKGEDQKSPLSIVTAMVDKINVKYTRIAPDQDVIIDGHVTWVGSTSMEVTMNVDQKQNGVITDLLEAKFLMVARDPENKCKAFVNPLIIENAEEEEMFKEGEASKKIRAEQARKSLLKMPPGREETQLIHNLFLSTLDQSAASFRRPKKPEGSIWMEDAMLKNMSICFPEKRNLYNKIFGGFLMRKAFELGWANCYVYSKHQSFALAVDDISFHKPVEIGSLLYLSSQIAYTEGPYLQVKVHAEIVDPQTGVHETSNVFYFTFHNKQNVPPVVPKTYAEYMTYVEGKRHFESLNTN